VKYSVILRLNKFTGYVHVAGRDELIFQDYAILQLGYILYFGYPQI